MATVFARLADSAQLTASAAAYVTNAAGHDTVVQSITLHNSDTAPHVVTLYRVPDNAGAVGTAAAANQVLKKTLEPLETFMLEANWFLGDTNDTIQGLADTAAKVTICADGLDIT